MMSLSNTSNILEEMPVARVGNNGATTWILRKELDLLSLEIPTDNIDKQINIMI